MTAIRFLQNYCLTMITNTIVDGNMVVGQKENFINLGQIIQVEDIIDISDESISLFFPEGKADIPKSIIEVLGLPKQNQPAPCGCKH